MIAIDPGVRSCGVAAFTTDGTLAFARNEPLDRVITLAGDFNEIVVELPQTYGGRAAGNSDANVLIALGRVVGRFEQVSAYWRASFRVLTPYEWKSNIPPDRACARAWALLTLDERRRVDITPAARAFLSGARKSLPDSATHPLDAIGLGLVACGRARKGLIPRASARSM